MAAADGEVPLQNQRRIVGHTEFGQGLAVALQPVNGNLVAQGPRNAANAPVAQAQQVAGGDIAAVDIVNEHRLGKGQIQRPVHRHKGDVGLSDF